MDIITDYETLSERSDEVDVKKDNQEIREIIVQLKNKMREENLVYLTAPQVGIKKRLFVINFNGELRTFINPMISKSEGFELVKETCYSIPDKTFIIPRNNKLRVVYQKPLGDIASVSIAGLAAKVFQHCVDHLDGVLVSDLGLQISEDFEKASKEEQEQVLALYLDSLDARKKTVDEEIQNDEELKKLNDGIEFLTRIKTGEVEIEHSPIEKPAENKEEENKENDT